MSAGGWFLLASFAFMFAGGLFAGVVLGDVVRRMID